MVLLDLLGSFFRRWIPNPRYPPRPPSACNHLETPILSPIHSAFIPGISGSSAVDIHEKSPPEIMAKHRLLMQCSASGDTGLGSISPTRPVDVGTGTVNPTRKRDRQRAREFQRQERISRGRRRHFVCENKERVGRLRASFESEFAPGMRWVLEWNKTTMRMLSCSLAGMFVE